MKRWIKILPWITCVSLLFFVLLVFLGASRKNFLISDPSQKQQAQILMDNLSRNFTNNPQDSNFEVLLNQTMENKTTASLWVFDMDGNIKYAQGSTAQSVKNINKTELPILDILNSLPEGTLSDDQVQLLIHADLIQAEGEHNDIYHHLVSPLYNQSGEMVAILGMAYHVNSLIDQPSLVWKLSLLIGVLSFGIYWLSIPLWVYFDAKYRKEKAWVWFCFTLLGNLAALMAYLLTRQTAPKQIL